MTRIALALGLLACPLQDAPESGRTVTHDGRTAITVTLPVSDAAKHVACVLSFPEPVARALVPWNEEDISIDPDGADVMVKLLKAVEGDLAFRGKSGTLYRFHVRPAAAGAAADRYVKVVVPEPEPSAPSPSAKSGAIELIRAMRSGRVPPDARVTAPPSTTAPLFQDGRVEIRPRFLYAADHHRGLVLDLKNVSRDETFRVDLTAFAGRELLLAGARDLLVPPGGSTRLYLVFARPR